MISDLEPQQLLAVRLLALTGSEMAKLQFDRTYSLSVYRRTTA